jgi:plasmid stabilization system protein ParE
MKVIICETAEDDLDRIFARMAQDNPAAAADMTNKIRQRISLLELDSCPQAGCSAALRTRFSRFASAAAQVRALIN